jgi:hypothetical protein
LWSKIIDAKWISELNIGNGLVKREVGGKKGN